jgi:hypothetical protein
VTREEAINIATGPYAKASNLRDWSRADCFVDALEALGLLKFDTVDDAMFRAAGKALVGAYIHVSTASYIGGAVKLEESGAYEILDVLRKSGFKITGPEK